VLQDKLRISNKKLEEYETRFKCQEETTQKLMLEYQARLEESEERLRRQQEDKEIQMKGIISRYRGGGSAGDGSKAGSLAGVRAGPCSGESRFFGGAGRFPVWVFQHLFTCCPCGLQPLWGVSIPDSLGPPISVTWDKGDPDILLIHKGKATGGESWQPAPVLGAKCSFSDVLERPYHHPITPSYKSFSPPSAMGC